MIKMIYNSVIVRGGGDIASGTIQKLHRSGFKVLVLEIEKPTCIRRKVAFSEAVYNGKTVIEGIEAVLIREKAEIISAWEEDVIPVAIDKEGKLIDIIKPYVVVDAILAKKNLGTNRKMAPITIGLGPGFNAGKDVDVVIETMRGHNLGRLIFHGFALENTGLPGEIGGCGKDRVIYSPCDGRIKNLKVIGDIVQIGEVVAIIEKEEVKSKVMGIIRGIIRNESIVSKGLKIADIDPRITELKNFNTISDKARNIGGGVLEAILFLRNTIKL
ncbi:selenium-dependent molybdenum cofactor biosynthesis protein YqeB [Clostridium magnum]|nr:selenium-dependent molybdenum cofactor biosynthesis protein YqeB [Clostridium magnum]